LIELPSEAFRLPLDKPFKRHLQENVMKAKFLFGFAFIVSALLSGCSTSTPHAPAAVTESKVLYIFLYQYNGDVFCSNLDKVTHWKKKAATDAAAENDGTGPKWHSGEYQELRKAVCEVFTDAGIDLDSPNALFVNDRLGMVCFRGTQSEGRTVEGLVEKLNAKPFTKMSL
jgi:hypothetical protein